MDDINQNYYRFDFIGVIDEIASASLYDLGFEAFEEKEISAEGYIPEHLITAALIAQIQSIHAFSTYEIIEQQNWNAIWESSFEPISISDQIYVRATFHPSKDLPYEIIIDPKMAFGTGHHATTYLVLAEMLKTDFKNKSVLDFGCGSGILAIAAEKLGASSIHAIDYDSWSVENTTENMALNQCLNIRVSQIDHLVEEIGPYDVILANITRDILLKNSADIIRLLAAQGVAIYSGFIEVDLEKIIEKVESFGIKQLQFSMKEDWCVLLFRKD